MDDYTYILAKFICDSFTRKCILKSEKHQKQNLTNCSQNTPKPDEGYEAIKSCAKLASPPGHRIHPC